MHARTRLLTTVITYALVALLAGSIGYRLGSGLSLKQIVGLAKQGNISELARITNPGTPKDHSEVDFSLFWDVWNRLERDYYDPSKIDARKMVYGAISGMTGALGDHYTVFLPPEDKQRLTQDLQGEFDGVGIQLGYVDGQLAVVAPLKDHPAEKAGVKAGDYILRIIDKDKKIDRDAVGMTAEEAVPLIRGRKGTKVTLQVLTKGEEPRTVELVRDTIEVPSLESEVMSRDGKNYYHININRFGDKTVMEWEKTVETILADPAAAGIILDVRNNPGGYLQAAVDIASDLIDGGVIVSQKGRAVSQSYTTTRKARLRSYPVNVLMNKGSASASEILAGALRDRRNAKLIGETSFGKGTVQDAQVLPEGAGLNITIARWLLPSGETIQDTGLKPTQAVEDNPETPDVDEVLEAGLAALP